MRTFLMSIIVWGESNIRFRTCSNPIVIYYDEINSKPMDMCMFPPSMSIKVVKRKKKLTKN